MRAGVVRGLCAALGLMPSVVLAHAYLVTSDPPHQAALDVPPATIRLQFSEPVEAAFAKLVLQCDGKPMPGSLKVAASPDRRTLTAKSPSAVTGRCVLDWSIVARDGHRTRGELVFQVSHR